MHRFKLFGDFFGLKSRNLAHQMHIHPNVAQRYERRCEGESVVEDPRMLRAQIHGQEDEGNERHGSREDVKSKQEERIAKNKGTLDALRGC